MPPKVLAPQESYTFSKYFDLPFAPQDILADLDCTLERADTGLRIWRACLSAALAYSQYSFPFCCARLA